MRPQEHVYECKYDWRLSKVKQDIKISGTADKAIVNADSAIQLTMTDPP